MNENLLEQTADLPPETDPTKDYFKELVGEGRKFKDEQALARSKYEADQYIEILKRRIDETRDYALELRKENMARARLEDLVDQMTKQRQASSDNTPANEDINQPVFDPKQIDSLVSNKIQEYELTKRQTENWNFVRDKLQQRYGNNYKAAVKEQIEDLGITEQELNEMARKQPKVLIKTLGLDQRPNRLDDTAPPRSTAQGGFAPTGQPERTWSWYQNQKRERGLEWYLDRKTAIQMQEDAIRLGEKFRDGNYFVKGLHE